MMIQIAGKFEFQVHGSLPVRTSPEDEGGQWDDSEGGGSVPGVSVFLDVSRKDE